MENADNRESWNTRVGFILAAVGSAVGLGNIWRFPYLTAESGGASFVLLYLILLFLIGIPVMITEFVIGRKTRRSPVQALIQSGNQNWQPLGILFVVTGFTILSYYSVVAGWTIRYIGDAIFGNLLTTPPGEYFASVSSGHTALLFHFIFMILTTGIVISGVKKGIERSVKILIPLLIILMVGLAIWGFMQPESLQGYNFYLKPDLNKLFSHYSVLGFFSIPFFDLNILANAAGQTFFTLSLGMGAMITYSSYLSREEDLIEETLIIAFSNFSISFLAGLTVFPIIATFGLSEQIQESTVATLFIAIPEAFQQIGGFWGASLCVIFFGSLMLAAFTSAISLLEVVTSSLIDEMNLDRRSAAIFSGLSIFLVGIPSAYNTDFLGLADSLSGNLFLMLGGLFLAFFVGWQMVGAREELKRGLRLPSVSLWKFSNKYLVPPVLLSLIIFSLQDLRKGFELSNFKTNWGLLGYGWFEYLVAITLLILLGLNLLQSFPEKQESRS